jgi:hypothetical protein
LSQTTIRSFLHAQKPLSLASSCAIPPAAKSIVQPDALRDSGSFYGILLSPVLSQRLFFAPDFPAKFNEVFRLVAAQISHCDFIPDKSEL